MIIVELKNLLFHAFHGVYEGEKKTGNDFEIDLVVKYDDKKVKLDNLNSIINYEELFEIVKKRMAVPTPLLEEVAEGIIRKIRHQYPFIKETNVSIYKLNAPIEGFQGKIGITLQKKFDD